MKKLKQLQIVVLAFVLIMSLFSPAASAAEKGTAKNVILMIPDGLGASYLTAARLYKGEELSFEKYVKGLMKTYSANTSVTDSAAAGTAMATGYKTDNGKISVTPDGTEPDSILDGARNDGKATGLVATSRITHATPAVFVSHDASRGNEVALAQQYINNVDVILGGGQDMFTLQSEGGKQPERNLVEEAKAAGYDYITTKSEMADVSSNKVLGLFAKAALTYEIDRVDEEQPSLSDMTEFAIDVLQKDEDGFFLMVEGSQIDWAGHGNDPTAAIHDVLEFEKAVDVALEFAKEDKETLVVIVGDHETGGMVIGSTHGGYADNIEVLKSIKASNNTVARALHESATKISLENGKEVDGEYYIHIRDAVAQMNGELEYDSKTKQATINAEGMSVTFNLADKVVKQGNEMVAFDLFLDQEESKNYMNVKDLFRLFGYDVAIGTSKDKPELTTAYLLHVNKVTAPYYGFDLTADDVELITSVNWNGYYDVPNVLGTVVSNHAYITWGTRNHSGVEVPLYAYGVGADHFVGLLENIQLPRVISYLMGTEIFEDEVETIEELENRRTN
ncbi:alkaline phosphatase [Bacillus salinus]|uniref:alkaline phosphatase n=1 Tax=Bacillus sp. HMF5848 TaxID=2495421 RepID=UPI0021AE2289|nr:alkaline phosphatase [Bacillus sp. HMF5848]